MKCYIYVSGNPDICIEDENDSNVIREFEGQIIDGNRIESEALDFGINFFDGLEFNRVLPLDETRTFIASKSRLNSVKVTMGFLELGAAMKFISNSASFPHAIPSIFKEEYPSNSVVNFGCG